MPKARKHFGITFPVPVLGLTSEGGEEGQHEAQPTQMESSMMRLAEVPDLQDL